MATSIHSIHNRLLVTHLAAILLFILTAPPARADIIQFNTDTGVMTINGSTAASFFGVPVQTSVVGGVMQFRFFGDLAFISSDVVGAVGSRPLSLFAGNDMRVGPGAVFNFNAAGQIGKLGGGSGGVLLMFAATGWYLRRRRAG